MSEETTAPEQTQEEVGLSYGDITAAVQIIDVCSQRGAIKGDELVQVGTVRERFVAFLRHAQENGEEIGELPSSAYNQQTEAPVEEEVPAEEAE
jgi:hypothetical protein